MRRFVFIISLILYFSTGFSQFIVNFNADKTSGCDTLTVQFKDLTVASNIEAWLWDFGDNSFSEIKNPLHHYSAPGNYTVKLTVLRSSGSNLQTASFSRTEYIKVMSLPPDTFAIQTALHNSSFSAGFYGVDNSDSLGYVYTWSFGDGDTAVGSAVTHTYSSTGPFYMNMKVVSAQGCVSLNSDTLIFKDTLFVPNVFSPNGDGYNDEFVITTNGSQTFQLQVFCRWGNLVYQTVAKNIRWDGRNSIGVIMIPGTYFYSLKSVDGSASITKSGFVEIVQ